jgi:serine/threonine-protein kinase
MVTPSMSHVSRGTFHRSEVEGLDFLQQRVRLFAAVVSWIFVTYITSVTLMRFVFPEVRSDNDHWSYVVGGITLLWIGTIWWLARGKPRSERMLHMMDISGLIDISALVAVTTYLVSDVPIVPIGAYVGLIFLIFTRAIIVPSTALRTAVISALATLPPMASTLAITFLHPERLIAAPGVQVAMGVLWSTVAVAVASIGSRVIFNLREQVREAKQLGQYTLDEKIGEGGMGSVYRAHHAMLRRPTAVKLLPPEKSGEAQLERFEREVQLTAELTHPNTVAIYDYGRSYDGVFYYAMEHLDGVDLETLVERHGPQPVARVIHLLIQVCGALAEAHEHGLVHRDIKPSNIFLCWRGGVPDVAKVLDFGLVKDLQHGDDKLTAVDVIAGTPSFMAPEAITAPDEVGPVSDLYSLGAVAYYLTTGENVFEGATLVEVCGHHVHTKPERMSKRLGKPLPKRFEQLVMQCLEKKQAQRPEDAKALGRVLRGLPESEDWSQEDAEEWWDENESTHSGAHIFTSGRHKPRMVVDVGERESA